MCPNQYVDGEFSLMLQSIKDLPILQDAPPPGGFPSIRIERRLPNTGPTGIAIFGATAAVMGYGFYQVTNVKAATAN